MTHLEPGKRADAPEACNLRSCAANLWDPDTRRNARGIPRLSRRKSEVPLTSPASRLRIMVVLGTRPEAIKMAPLIHELQAHSDDFRTMVVSTGQHREMLRPMLELFDIELTADLDLQKPGQTLEHVVSSVLSRMPDLFAEHQPDLLVAQGDTATTFASSLAAFFRDVRVVHLEAGLRTDDPREPFPEEMNRRLTSRLADLHLAPTERAAQALRDEGVSADRVVLTGNTVVDALQWLRRERADEVGTAAAEALGGIDLEGRRLCVVTGHRRESFGDPFRDFCRALLTACEQHPDLDVVYPVHLNPQVQAPVHELLDGHPHIHLLEPISYPAMVGLLDRAAVVITDSGGIQEEAPSFGVPVLVTRDRTERTEGIDAGVSVLVGTDPARILPALDVALSQGKSAAGENPFGDGQAARRSVEAIRCLFGPKS
jgi:UDP-N-acetylglucosamine 2-epimerase (non-hydrolysing)